MRKRRKLPIGTQSFKVLRENNFVYVDKTNFVWELAEHRGHYFLSRPRRFGKSLFLSTLEAYFLGKRELFDGLAVQKLEDAEAQPWQAYPVFRFDFSPEKYEERGDLEELLHRQLERYEKIIIGCTGNGSVSTRFSALIETAYRKTGKQVVVLVDEYDKPLLATRYTNKEVNEQYRAILKGFYSVFKASDEYLRLVFLTGVSQFSRLSIFSDMNQFINISTDKRYASICGITEEELEDNFKAEIEDLMNEQEVSYEKALDMLRTQYDGYRFCNTKERLYNPFSLLSALSSSEIENYWYQTGTPTFLINLLKAGNFDIRLLEKTEGIAIDILRNSEPQAENPIPILFQSGYLSLKEYNKEFQNYSLGFPNEEVKYAFLQNLLPAYLSHQSAMPFSVQQFVIDIRAGKVDSFMTRLKAVIASLPYGSTNKNDKAMRERDYHIALYLVFTLMGQYTRTEVHSLKGRADIVVETADAVYIFELKLLQRGTAEEAIEQIKQQGYTEPYKASGKRITAIGVAFDEELENLGDWKISEIF